jgi:hypothetical protein
MNVEDRIDISAHHSIEWGTASWSDSARSIRNRYDTDSGFSPHNSSELPFEDLERLVVESAKRDYISPDMAARMIEELAASISRQSPTSSPQSQPRGEPTFRPWVGDQYETEGFEGMQLLILGESHYGTPGPDDGGLTRHVVMKYGRNEGRHAFFTTTAKLVLGLTADDYLSDEQQKTFWDRVAFYNYVQDYAGETPDGEVTPEMWRDAQEPFWTVVEKLAPDAIIILGKRLGKHVPSEEIDVASCVVTHPSAPGFAYDENQEAVHSMLAEL